MDAPTHGSLAGFTPRQSSYLRISPTLVLQLILYLEPHHVEWMNVGVFERILVALKDRIPLKLQQEDLGKVNSGSKQKREKVDVFRGTDYQMAFFFRKTNDKHVVLLKEKHLHYVTRSVPQQHCQPQPRPRTRSPSLSVPPPPPHPHTKPSELAHDPDTQQSHDEDDDALGVMGPPRKRTRLARGSDDSAQPLSTAREQEQAQASTSTTNEEGLVDYVKPEPIEEDPLVALSEGHFQPPPSPPPPVSNPLFREESGTPFGEQELRGGREEEQQQDGEEEEFKEEVDDDMKPQLKVSYQKFEIFNRSLVVIVEPYPPLPLSALQRTPRPGFMNTEIRQLSASVQPRASSSATPFPNLRRSESVQSRANSLSATPAPRSRRQGGSLFRRESTGSERGTPVVEEQGEEDEQMRGLREMSEVFRDGEDWGKRLEEEGEGSDEDLESVEEIMRRRKMRMEKEREASMARE